MLYEQALQQALNGMEEKHLNIFAASLNGTLDPNALGGKKAQSFAVGFPDVELNQLPDRRISRDDVLALVRDPNVRTVNACAAVLAWGGMRVGHRDHLVKTGEWLIVADKIRQGSLDRRTAYEALSKLRIDGRLKGAGPAFFTKLIYFLLPRAEGITPRAYIMDQWAGCSVNLLTGRNDIVMINSAVNWQHIGGAYERVIKNFHVSDQNSSNHYEAFCTQMDALTFYFERTPEEIDCVMMGGGAQPENKWRRHLREQRRHQT